ncbi:MULTISPECIES: sigma-54 interaction domain-containing protein [Methylocaldum]|jgi:two-component system response regulator HydG|uniref:sigma-54 interaction domain-containing protein n=1 Tax=unclassified Methylocaldum TaxID=2622260 RepID=UPI00098ADCC1|nr:MULTISPECIES: sigma-54 dependent transcriptional regulator [unclassified Methylocaldum]MBP1148544.1 transcriptional regulator with PAS, ATPase and Fis domain [Methylocaldum sp. RMAD-M]MVF21946.1 sigma-54-dependent Fis family transcriptional regulator [Methylocaldum sp. BRCS4]
MFEKLIGQSPNFEALLRSARMIAATDVTVLVVGETGTGKEVLAHALKEHSPRANKPFITLNCAALPEALAESELFGHRKGSFTGAVNGQTGRLQAADGGTVFLDEVDSLPMALQAKFLRFLETGEIQPVGETHTLNVDVRIIAATNANLQEKIARGEFRKDLYYRLNVVPIEIPPLRERMGDIQLLLQHFMMQFAEEHKLPEASFSKAALSRLATYSWPGNVRELRNVCERLSILLAGRTIDEGNLPLEIVNRVPSQKPVFDLPELGIDLEKVEMDLIRQALARTNGNRSRSARLLGISRDTLLYRMQKYGIS